MGQWDAQKQHQRRPRTDTRPGRYRRGQPARGWSRLLFKVHNFTSGFQGTVSLRNSTNANLNEPLVNVFDLGGFYSYGVGYEQDAWYPTIYLSNFYGAANPQPNHNFYGNDTTVTASGTAAGGGPVPFGRSCIMNGAMR